LEFKLACFALHGHSNSAIFAGGGTSETENAVEEPAEIVFSPTFRTGSHFTFIVEAVFARIAADDSQVLLHFPLIAGERDCVKG